MDLLDLRRTLVDSKYTYLPIKSNLEVGGQGEEQGRPVPDSRVGLCEGSKRHTYD